ncbi:hypothetical protein Enr13x_71940 [Stieleria neptunia]|uniref:Uncharacterized protein n=1 Tax=Stieleria neptunia TaxID=2527979 RepID=A0A518I2E5_9BACT|nr:hypothetical protein Enr13x_71940 [Stieleria neptunia]
MKKSWKCSVAHVNFSSCQVDERQASPRSRDRSDTLKTPTRDLRWMPWLSPLVNPFGPPSVGNFRQLKTPVGIVGSNIPFRRNKSHFTCPRILVTAQPIRLGFCGMLLDVVACVERIHRHAVFSVHEINSCSRAQINRSAFSIRDPIGADQGFEYWADLVEVKFVSIILRKHWHCREKSNL